MYLIIETQKNVEVVSLYAHLKLSEPHKEMLWHIHGVPLRNVVALKDNRREQLLIQEEHMEDDDHPASILIEYILIQFVVQDQD